MKRRSFIKYSSLLSTPIIVGGIPVSSIARSAMTGFLDEESDRVLVLIQLNGGNDGLATLIPIDQQDILSNVRSNIVIPESSILGIEDNLGLHPNMGGIKSLYEDGKVNMIQSVGYPDQNRSHFRSSDIWHSGSNSNEYLNTGWLGRYLDSQYDDYPANYPNEEFLDPFAMTIGSVVTETCQGIAGNFSMTVVDPNNLSQLGSPPNNELASGCAMGQFDFLSDAIEKSNEYSERIVQAYDLGSNSNVEYDDNNPLGQKLKGVARLIAGGLKSKIYVVSLGGFDTHAAQTEDDDPTIGVHATLLQYLSDAIKSFQDDITNLGFSDKVIGMTYSEFGRRIRSNFSLGTDHGDAAPLIVFGDCVNPGIVGSNPLIPNNPDQNEAIPMQYDFRSVYGSMLMDWFGAEESLVNSLFNHDFQYISIAGNCELPSSVEEEIQGSISIKTYPNPTSDISYLEFESENEWIKISLSDVMGKNLKTLSNQKFSSGNHKISIDVRDYPSGNYFINLKTKDLQKTVKLVKIGY